jgi:hypothetical protein
MMMMIRDGEEKLLNFSLVDSVIPLSGTSLSFFCDPKRQQVPYVESPSSLDNIHLRSHLPLFLFILEYG